MKKILVLLVGLVALSIPVFRYHRHFNTHELSLGQTIRRKNVSSRWIFADLAGNNYDYMLSAAPQGKNTYMLQVRDQIGKDISQINYSHPLRGITVLSDPRSKAPWMFLSINDQKATGVHGFHYIWEPMLKREERQFDAIARTDTLIAYEDYDWSGTLHPKLLEDIDNDGSPELVCLAFDSFTINPRGLMVYDFDSGRLKWRFDLSTCISSLLCDDFDGDGEKELVCGTIAYKNTDQEMRGMDDAHSWLMVIDARGRLLHHEMVNEGFSQVLLASDDMDGDAQKEILAVCSTKGNAELPNSVKWLNWTGKRFIQKESWLLHGNLEFNNPETIYSLMDGEGRKLVLLAAMNSPLIVLDSQLNKVNHDFNEPVSSVWGVEDLDLDGRKEILLETRDNRLVVLSSDLKSKAELANPFNLDDNYSVHIVYTGFGKPPKIALAIGAEVRYYQYRRLPLWEQVTRFIWLNLDYLSLMLLLALLLLLIYVYRRRRIIMMGINNLGQGTVLMASKDRILHINDYMLDFLKDEYGNLPPGNLKSLSRLYPDLAALMPDFEASKDSDFNQPMLLGRQQMRHNVRIQKLGGLTSKFLITAQPDLPAPGDAAATLAWADTARRLSHNVRRHITNIILALKPLQTGGLDDKQLGYTDIIRSEIEKIRIFTHAFQRFTELKDYELKLQDVIPSLEHCLERLTIPTGIKLIKNWDLASVEAWIEPIRFEEALGNVIANALDAMEEGGTLHLTVKKFPNHSGLNGRQSVMIEVEDSGKGIPAKYLEEVWQPFFTTKNDGTGIGLPETRKIITSMGGTVLVQSEEGVGTVVTFWLKGSTDG
jgi:signal transduction histidine kinase